MDYKSIAEAACKRAEALIAEIRTVKADESLEAEARSAKVTALEADLTVAEDEARAAVEDAEREARVADFAKRAASVMVMAPKSDKPEGRDLNADFRALAEGEIREVQISGQAGEFRTGTTSNLSTAVPRDFVAQVIESMREESPILGMARILNTNGGAPLDFPRKATHVSNGATVAEGVAYAKGDMTLNAFTLGATKYGVIVQVTRELIEDAAFDVTSMIAEDAGVEIGRLVSAAAVAKVLTDATLGAATAGASLAADDLLTFYHSLVTGYRRNATWLMNDATALAVRKLKGSDNNYLWQTGLVAGQPDVLLGRPVQTDYNVPANVGAQVDKVALLGDFSKFIVRQVNDLRVVRSDEYGFDTDVVAFKVTWRGDFGLSDTAAIKYLTQN